MRLLKILVAIAICLSLSVVAYAHPGRTDSKGGHMNHSTGEYHYHHGYSEHQHYDKDGDGILDCPYSFNDKTGSSSGSSNSSGKTSSKTPSKPSSKTESSEIKAVSSEKAASSKNGETFWSQIKEVLIFLWNVISFCFNLFFAWLCLFVVSEIIMRLFKWIFRR